LPAIRNDKTRRAYRRDVREFVAFSGSISFEKLRSVTRAHVIAWRKDLEARNKKGSTVRRKLSSLSSLFD
jgi:site-specific recombinase XerD